ncbi:hypothetical protein [Taibaiella chishuiensis]|uniref:Uncharacterized protein n=1 Tax=Taibaiella chishuiensis TaxID=1434707 RepID=A0A2P8D9J2_9BACT|nr:hypothetical protein [Taibaiella chishuiensis]PSK93873.1 hypothetical protein B0I18_10121 [Taibaiella chishuiensis]
MKRNILIALFLCGSLAASAQSNNSPDPRITAVYGTFASKLSTEQLAWLQVKLQRSQVVLEPYAQGETYPRLSSLKVVDKYIPGLQADNFAQPQQVNPLKYVISFQEQKDLRYRIDGTDYVLLIRKKN